MNVCTVRLWRIKNALDGPAYYTHSALRSPCLACRLVCRHYNCDERATERRRTSDKPKPPRTSVSSSSPLGQSVSDGFTFREPDSERSPQGGPSPISEVDFIFLSQTRCVMMAPPRAHGQHTKYIGGQAITRYMLGLASRAPPQSSLDLCLSLRLLSRAPRRARRCHRDPAVLFVYMAVSPQA